MAEVDDGEYEVKDEELVDFEGSDYGFNSDEEVEAEVNDAPNHNRFENERIGSESNIGEVEVGDDNVDTSKPVEVAVSQSQSQKREGAESGEIEEEKDEKDDGVVVQPAQISVAPRQGEGGRVGEARQRKHHKADLEDGELDDAAMVLTDPEGSDHEAEGNGGEDDEDENERRERKRRKDRFAAERHLEDKGRKGRKEAEELALAASRQYGGRGSERPMGDRGNIARVGRGMSATGLNRPNMAPGIMGPGRPLVPIDFGGPLPLRPLGQGFAVPIGAMSPAGRPNMQNHFREAMAVQEHMLQSHQMMQFAHGNVPGPVRPPMGAPPMRPLMGLEFVGVPGGPHGIMHLQGQGPDLSSPMNFSPSMDGYGRSPRPAYGAARGAGGGTMLNQLTNRLGPSPRGGVGRQQGLWASAPMAVEMQQPQIGRGRGQGRGQVVGPIWGDPQAHLINTQRGVIGQGMCVNGGSGSGPGPMIGLVPNKRQGSLGPVPQGNLTANRDGISNLKRMELRRSEMDGLWRVDRGDRGGGTSNGIVPHGRVEVGVWSASPGPSLGTKHERENVRDRCQTYSNSITGPTVPLGNGVGLNAAAVGNHLIQLGGPVQKSRVLTVSGFPENTSMSVVVEAFEKQGKITDFRKEEKGDAFTITFASVPEAISAKRSLHRSFLAGQQITVEYAVQRF